LPTPYPKGEGSGREGCKGTVAFGGKLPSPLIQRQLSPPLPRRGGVGEATFPLPQRQLGGE